MGVIWSVSKCSFLYAKGSSYFIRATESFLHFEKLRVPVFISILLVLNVSKRNFTFSYCCPKCKINLVLSLIVTRFHECNMSMICYKNINIQYILYTSPSFIDLIKIFKKKFVFIGILISSLFLKNKFRMKHLNRLFSCSSLQSDKQMNEICQFLPFLNYIILFFVSVFKKLSMLFNTAL